MRFATWGDKQTPAVLFFHAMGVTGESSEPVARCLRERYFCILPTSTVYCAGQKYVGKADEVRQTEEFLRQQGVTSLALVVASSIGADLALAFLTQTKLPVAHVFFDGGQLAQITTASVEEMKDAQIHPEDHEELTVRVAGYSAYFNRLPESIQNEVIERTSQEL